ncbi:hypothetical protein [Magnetospirillum sp. SS-4]|uniref:hypothetical protein n=1 Tax=Magnetospirillum sp. SS-4 TaxID=2681465 RepID=UPI0015739529|nr:hypothetical protein [Magnetospirillum sp. SS-4]
MDRFLLLGSEGGTYYVGERALNPAAKAVVLAATANAGSVVPDDDPLSLGCAGFDAAVPQVVAGFLKG